MHIKMSSALCFNLDQSKTCSSGNGLTIANSFDNGQPVQTDIG